MKLGTVIRLRIGNRDDRYPQMWRIHFDSCVSDTVNLTRAKDAAIRMVHPSGNEVEHWDYRQTAAEPSPGASAAPPPRDTHPSQGGR